jgi:hypothetical protein
MSSNEERVLSLAREAWRAGLPSDAEAEFAAQRLAKRFGRSGRRRRSRRTTLVLAFAVVLVGSLAYAASGGSARWFGSGRASEALPLRGAARVGLGEVPELLDHAQSGQVAETPAAPAAEPPPAPQLQGASAPMGGPVVKGEGTPNPAASWRAVDEALDAKDDARAKKALSGLAQSSDATTRAKARLGLAQLARSKGDCVEARRLAFEVSAMHDIDPAVAKRARAIVLECE